MFSFKVNEELILYLLTEQHAPDLLVLVEANREMLQIWQPGWTEIQSIEGAKDTIRFNLGRFARNDEPLEQYRLGCPNELFLD